MKKPLEKTLGAPNLPRQLHEEAKKRSVELLGAIARYHETPYQRNVGEPPCIWRKGKARLLDYGLNRTHDAKRIVLFVPSLINRYYVLDLETERSLLRYMAEENIYPLVIDWGAPEASDEACNIDYYVRTILIEAIRFIYHTGGMPVTLVGYCMGGVMALAAAQLCTNKLNGLALLATPWDFHCETFRNFILDQAGQTMLSEYINAHSLLPASLIQSLFTLTSPFIFEHKFRRFMTLDPESRQARDFIALEHWVNDGVPMTRAAAQDVMIGWAQQNQLAAGKWKVAGKRIKPQNITLPVFLAIPQNDHIVPHDCATPLATLLPRAKIIHPSAGHVGMIVGRSAKRELWQPLARWIKTAKRNA